MLGVEAAAAVAVAPANGAAVAVDFGVDTSLSANPLSIGNVVVGAVAIADECGTGTVAGGGATGVVPAGAAVAPSAPTTPVAGVPAAARFVDDGDAAGVRPATAAGCGVDCVDGNAGFAERATAEESSGAFSRLNHANPGPDLQPTTTAKAVKNSNELSVVRFISMTAYPTCAHAHSKHEVDGGALTAQRL